MDKNIQDLAKDISIELRRWANTKQDKHKEIYVKAHHSPTSKF
jgi:hypothetical protein